MFLIYLRLNLNQCLKSLLKASHCLITKLQYADVMSPHFLHHPCVAFVFCVKQSVVGWLLLQLQHNKQETSA